MIGRETSSFSKISSLQDGLEARGQGEQGLAGPGPADQGDQFDIRVEQQLKGHPLLLRAGMDIPGALVGGIEMVEKLR